MNTHWKSKFQEMHFLSTFKKNYYWLHIKVNGDHSKKHTFSLSMHMYIWKLLVLKKHEHAFTLAALLSISQATEVLEAAYMLQCNLFRFLVFAWGRTESHLQDKIKG